MPFYRQIVDQVTELVRTGRLAPGERLPSVRELAVDLLVSTITIRKAYDDLERAGLIALKQGQGTFVAHNVGPAVESRARDDAREALEQAVARARRLGLSDAEIVDEVNKLLGEGSCATSSSSIK